MHSSALRDRRRFLPAIALGAIAAAACAAIAAPSLATALTGPRYEKLGYLHCVESGADRYSFDPVWRVESFRTVDDTTGLEAGRGPADGARRDRLRDALLRKLDVRSLDQIPTEGAAEVSAIRALGYI